MSVFLPPPPPPLLVTTSAMDDPPPWDGPSKILSPTEVARGRALEARAAANQPRTNAMSRSRRAQKRRTPDWIEARAITRRLIDGGQGTSREDVSSVRVWKIARASAHGFANSRHGALLRRGVSRAEAAARLFQWRAAIEAMFSEAQQSCGTADGRCTHG
jgi:hypothetical protein